MHQEEAAEVEAENGVVRARALGDGGLPAEKNAAAVREEGGHLAEEGEARAESTGHLRAQLVD